MKRVLVLCLVSMATLSAHAAENDPIQQGQPYSAVFWTTTTKHTASGKSVVFMRRTVCTRDSYGTIRREIYHPTKGLQHNTEAPLERVLSSSSSVQSDPFVQSNKNSGAQELNLGASSISGFQVDGKRRTFRNSEGGWSRTVETWYSPSLSLPIHTESTDSRGDSSVSDLTEFHAGDYGTVTAAPAATKTIPLLTLYRGLFDQVAHMERDRVANDPARHVDMKQIEDHLRKKIGLSDDEWRTLVENSTSIAAYTHDASAKAHAFAKQDLAAQRSNPNAEAQKNAGRAALHNMQLDLNARLQKDIQALKNSLGAAAAGRIEAYLQGPLATAASVGMSERALLKAKQTAKEQAK